MSQQGHWYSEGAPPLDQPIEAPRTNTLGIVGFVLGIVGLCGCGGLVSPIGLVVSVIALFRQPRGWAIAGTILSALGCCCMLPIGLPVLLMATGIVSVSAFVLWIAATFATNPGARTALFAFVIGGMLIAYHQQNGSLPPTLDDLDLDPRILRDGWDRPFIYELDDKGGFVIRTIGADGVEGTADDFELEGVNRGGSIEIRDRRGPRPGPAPVAAPAAPADPTAPPSPGDASAPPPAGHGQAPPPGP